MDASIARNLARWFLPALFAGLLSTVAEAATIVVQEPYLELQSGPGRGYPQVYALERGEQAEVLEREHQWYRIRTRQGREGWVHRRFMGQTLAAAGIDPDRRHPFIDRYLSERLELGVSAGVFDDDALLGLYVGYAILPQLAVELHGAEVAGTYSNSRLYRLEAVYRPALDWPLQPYASVGVVRFENVPRITLADTSEADGNGFSAGLGVSRLVDEHLLLRADWRFHRVDLDGDDDFHAFTASVAFRF